MKFMVTWTVSPGKLTPAAEHFLTGGGQPPPGVTILGRWHNLSASGGWALYETDNPAALAESNAVWADWLQVHTDPVIEDAAAGAVLAKVLKK